MNILSLEKLKNLKLVDIINPKIVRFIWKTREPNICPLCESLDGKVMNSNDADFMTYQPPLHPRCKCRWSNITSDSEKIPNVNWLKPTSDLIKRYAPFWFLLPSKKKEEVELYPFAPESPNPLFNKDSILDIEWLNIENARQQMKDMETEMGRIIYVIFFLGSKGQTVLTKDAEQDVELEFTNREESLIREYATQYIISDGNDVVEEQIEKMFGIKKR